MVRIFIGLIVSYRGISIKKIVPKNIHTTLNHQYFSHLQFPFFLSGEARDYARCLKLKSQKEWKLFAKSRKNDPYIYYNPDTKYKDKGWISWSDWLGKE